MESIIAGPLGSLHTMPPDFAGSGRWPRSDSAAKLEGVSVLDPTPCSPLGEPTPAECGFVEHGLWAQPGQLRPVPCPFFHLWA